MFIYSFCSDIANILSIMAAQWQDHDIRELLSKVRNNNADVWEGGRDLSCTCQCEIGQYENSQMPNKGHSALEHSALSCKCYVFLWPCLVHYRHLLACLVIQRLCTWLSFLIRRSLYSKQFCDGFMMWWKTGTVNRANPHTHGRK